MLAFNLIWLISYSAQYNDSLIWQHLQSRDSLQVIEMLDNTDNTLDLITRLAAEYSPDSVVDYFEKALRSYVIDASPRLGEKVAKALLEYSQVVQHSENSIRSALLVSSATSLQGNTEEALAITLDALTLSKDINNLNLEARLLNELGYLHMNMRDNQKAIYYFDQVIEKSKTLENPDILSTGYLNKGAIYMEMQELDSAELYLQKAFDIAQSIDDLITEAYALGNLATVSFLREDYDRAIDYQSKGLAMEASLNDRLGMIDSHGILSVSYLALGKKNLAVYHYEKAYDLAHAINNTPKIMMMYEEGQPIFEALGDYKRAYELSKKYHQLYDSLLNAEKNLQFAELREKFETEQKEARITSLEEQQRIKDLEIQQQRNQNIILVVAAGLLLAIAFFVFLLFVQIRKRKQEVESRNETITKINKALNKSQDELLLSNKTKDKFFALIAHDLRGPVTSMQGIGRMLEFYNKKGDQQRINQLISQVDQSAQSVNHLLDNLLKWALSQTKGLNYQPTSFELGQMVEECRIIFEENLKAKQLTLHIDVDHGAVVEGDYNMISTVLRNLLSNAIKFSPVGEQIHLSTKQEADHLVISVEDHGSGIPKETLEKLNSNLPLASTEGTRQEKGTGLGLTLCQEFIKKHGSAIEINSGSYGTTITFHLNLVKEALEV